MVGETILDALLKPYHISRDVLMQQLKDPDFCASLAPSKFLQLSLMSEDIDAKTRDKLRCYYSNWNYLRSPRLAYWYDSQLDELLAPLKNKTDLRVLDAGCGSGTETLFLAIKGANVTGIDVLHGKIDTANARLSHLRDVIGLDLDVEFHCLSVLDTKGPYDLIWLEQSFHHMEPREQIVQHLADLLAPGGRLVFSEANGWNPLLQASLFKLRGFETIKRSEVGEGELIWGNERVLVPLILGRHLEKVGLKKESCRYFRIFPSGERFDRLLKLERMLCDMPLKEVFAPLFSHYNFVAVKP